jgi:hypothetical protein
MRRRISILLVILIVLVLLVGWAVAAHYRAKARLARYLRQLQAAGEKVTIAQAAPTPSPEALQAGHDLFLAASYLLANGSNYPPTMRYLAPGKAVVGWQQDPLANSECRNVWPGLRRELAQNADALAEVRRALRAPQLDYGLDYKQGPALLLPHLARLKGAVQQLSAAVVLDLHDGDLTNGFQNLEALAHLAQSTPDEPLLISELVRISISAIAANATWEALQCRDWTDSQLSALQSIWEHMDFFAQGEGALAMERASAQLSLEQARNSPGLARNLFSSGGPNSALNELSELGKGVLENPHEGIRNILKRYPGFWMWRWWGSYEDELAQAQIAQAAIEALRRAHNRQALGPALDGFGMAAARIQAAHPKAGMCLGFGTTNTTFRVLQRIQAMETQRAMTAAALALKRYQLRQGAYPSSLAALVPEFSSQVPRDPIDGQPLRYHLRPDGTFVLYSIGEDKADNGGDPTPQSAFPKQWARARDAVWPEPATTEEIQVEAARNGKRRIR